ncbi:hydrogenase small subunit [Desulfuribacillus alkaliarsenatis]|uniref:[NiFe] hydrogenase small subunit HydA n=1 Tax=Desulfuribacillus alkaliarsenatis TaxID=766136 RepID=A0A1E5G0R6_9FIRM|nr:hydrogenase small subunit [Desulfuribacillus alkaliarsenatis]OEF96496.1 [NiFe] hydrogenase small subunit HydA [Desulfuribacillus alkaliarsenatis]
MKETFYEYAQRRGYSRKDFLKFCTAITAIMGLEASFTPKVVKALETKERVPVIYKHFQECTGCSMSFIKMHNPIVADLLFDMISLDYHDTIMAASGRQAIEAAEKTKEEYKGKYILACEGSIPMADGGIHSVVDGKTHIDIFREYEKDCAAIISYGSCAAWGGVQAAAPNPTKATPIYKLTNKPVINVPGCPPIPDVMAGVITHILTFDSLPELDIRRRPKVFYRHRIHDNCQRRAYFDSGLFVEEFDDIGSKLGWCLYKVGCKGPVTYNSCSVMKWNDSTCWPVEAGNPCMGCSEDNFWDFGPIFTTLAQIPGTNIIYNPDKVGAAVVGAATAGVAVHAAATVAVEKMKKKDKEAPVAVDQNKGVSK